MEPLIHPEHVQRDFLKYSAQKIKHDLKKMHPAVLSRFKARVSVSTNPFNDVSSGAWGHAPGRFFLRTRTKAGRRKTPATA